VLVSTLPIRIYYEDTDAGGIVYYANYLKFFERGRTELLREGHIEQDVLLEKHIAFVVKKVELNYVKAARFNELITVKTEIIACQKASLQFKQEIHRENGELLCTATTLIACINIQKMKPMAIPSEITEVISSAR